MTGEELDVYVPRAVRATIEDRYYAVVNRQASLEALLQDPDFLTSPTKHPGLFADHGVVHVRDVAHQLLRLLDHVLGVLIPPRDPAAQAFMRSCGVMLAYVHDIGMTDFTPFGRTMHPEVAAHLIFSPAFDEIVATILAEAGNSVVARLPVLAAAGPLPQDARVVLRELLALAVAHSKSKIPVADLNDPRRLRAAMLHTLSTDLRLDYGVFRVEQARRALSEAGLSGAPAEELERLRKALGEAEHGLSEATARYGAISDRQLALARYYVDSERQAFAWLASDDRGVRQVVGDVVDTLRVLRAADALRQRGTMLKTSGGHETYVDQTTGAAIYALRSRKGELFLLTAPDPISAGEANIASSDVDPAGNLRLSFHRGAFVTPAIAGQAAAWAATVALDIQKDAIQSFERPAAAADAAGLKRAEDALILLEETDDNLAFGDMVAQLIGECAPQLRGRVHVVPSLEHIPITERARYLAATEFHGSLAARQLVLEHVAQSGHNTQPIDPAAAFDHVKVLHLARGEALLEAGSPPGFVYVPMAEGLRVHPLGGYESASIPAWTPVGDTGVIRGAARNATVMADDSLSLLVIPKSVYLKHWHHPYDPHELVNRLSTRVAAKGRIEDPVA
ncbi:MAG: hypothetical protein U0768_02295 [Anaerolineae bacterium]